MILYYYFCFVLLLQVQSNRVNRAIIKEREREIISHNICYICNYLYRTKDVKPYRNRNLIIPASKISNNFWV